MTVFDSWFDGQHKGCVLQAMAMAVSKYSGVWLPTYAGVCCVSGVSAGDREEFGSSGVEE